MIARYNGRMPEQTNKESPFLQQLATAAGYA